MTDGTWLRENNLSPVPILTTLKLICSTPMTAVSVKSSEIVDDGTLCRCGTNGFSQVLNFSATGGQTCEKNRNFNPRNSKPEVDIDVVPTAFETLCHSLKYNVINFGQVAPQ